MNAAPNFGTRTGQRLVLLLAVSLNAIAASMLLRNTNQGVDTQSARTFLVVDESGRPRIKLSGEGSPKLQFLSESGQAVVTLGFVEGGRAGLSVSGPGDREAVFVGSKGDRDSAGLEVYYDDGSKALACGKAPEGPAFVFSQKAGIARGYFGLKQDGTVELGQCDRLGKPRFAIAVPNTGLTSLLMLDDKGLRTIAMEDRGKEGRLLRFLDLDGSDCVSVGVDGAHRGALEFRGADEQMLSVGSDQSDHLAMMIMDNKQSEGLWLGRNDAGEYALAFFGGGRLPLGGLRAGGADLKLEIMDRDGHVRFVAPTK